MSMDSALQLLFLIIVVLVCLYLINRFAVGAELQRILQIAVVGIALIIVVWRYLLPMIG